MEQQFTSKYQYSKKQVGILTKAMLIAGLCFIAICGGAWGFSELFWRNQGAFINQWSIFLTIFLLLMVVGMVISMLWVKALSKKNSVALTVIIYILYIAIMSVSFGFVFAIVRWSFPNQDKALSMLAIAFGVTGGTFLLAAGISKLLSAKGVFTFGRLLAGCSMAMGILLIVSLILGIVGSCSYNASALIAEYNILFWMMAIMAFVSFGYMCIDMWTISKSEEFLNYVDGSQVPSSYVWFCGYKLLVDLLNIFLLAIWFILRIARN